MKTFLSSMLVAGLLSLCPTATKAQSTAEQEFVKECTTFATAQTERMLQAVGQPNGRNYPRTMNDRGETVTTDMYDWTPGFFPGSLWYLYELTGDAKWKAEARKWTNSLEPLKTFTGHHDLGFMMYCSYGNAVRLAAEATDRDILVQSAASLSSRYSPRTRTIKSWNYRKEWDGVTEWFYPVIIDNMMNLEMLFYASRVSGDPRYREVATTHAETTLKNHFRKDFTTYHVVNYDTLSGKVLHQATCQGYSDNSTWSRGQAWAVYGYTMVYRETGDKKFLAAAEKAAKAYLKRLPADLIPAWDFNAGQKGYTPEGDSYAGKYAGTELRDVSAAAITCSALFELGELTGKQTYIDTAVKMLHTLASPAYRATPGSNANFLLMHSVGSLPHRSEIDKPLTYADYYFLEALCRYKRLLRLPTSPDRAYWVDMLCKIAEPVLSNMAKGELQKNMQMEYSPQWDGRDKHVAYLETFGRLMAGIAPWLTLPDDSTAEGKKRAQMREWALKSYAHAVDPDSPDYLAWKAHHQVLVDAAYLAESFLRAPSLWQALDRTTQERYVKEFKGLRHILTPYNNWLLFRATIEAFLLSVGEEADGYALGVGTRKISEWYLSDGWYSDGPEFSLDYYNSYVIHPMFLDVLEVMEPRGLYAPVKTELALRRMQRYNQLLERMISPEGTFPAIGRSATYRMGAFQSLALAAWKYGLPAGMTNGSVRNALTAVMKNMYGVEGNFNEGGFLQLGFAGHQPGLADYYTNNGSLYMTSLVFLPLGLPSDHPFWTDPADDWTQRKAWSGRDFRKDYHESVRE